MRMAVKVLGCLALMAPCAWAAAPFERWDRDGSGRITPEELRWGVVRFEYFQVWDANEDGLLSPNELERIGVGLQRRDWTRGGTRNLDAAQFARILLIEGDRNGDGTLDEAEWEALQEAGWFEISN